MGATIVGRISDKTVIKWRSMRRGIWYPEDRLRAALIPFAIIVPLSVLTFGLVNRFVDGNLGLGLSLVCLFLTGVGVSGQLWYIRPSYYRRLIDQSFYVKGRYDFRGVRRVPGRRNAFSKFRNLGNN